MKHGKNALVAAAALAAATLLFCRFGEKAKEKAAEKIAEKVLEKQGGGKVDIENLGKDGQKISVTDEKGQTAVFSGNAVPESFPKDVPVYPGATPGYGVTATGDKGATVAVLNTTDDPAKVLTFYQAELPKNGWEIKTTVDSKAEGGMLLATKDTRQATVMIGKGSDAGASTISLTVAQGS
ncbi:MAG: hypothetical protein U0166_18745 [Acidobacteriota bacterium]